VLPIVFWADAGVPTITVFVSACAEAAGMSIARAHDALTASLRGSEDTKLLEVGLNRCAENAIRRSGAIATS